MLITQNCDFLLIWNCKTNHGVTVRSRWENSSVAVPPASLPDVVTHCLPCAKTSKPSRLKLWTQWQMVKHRSPVKWHRCHLVGGLHRDWCSSDLWYFSWSHVESVQCEYIFCVLCEIHTCLLYRTPNCGLMSQKTLSFRNHCDYIH